MKTSSSHLTSILSDVACCGLSVLGFETTGRNNCKLSGCCRSDCPKFSPPLAIFPSQQCPKSSAKLECALVTTCEF